MHSVFFKDNPPKMCTFFFPVPELIDRVFVKTSPKRSYSVIENERFGLVFAKTGSIISGTGQFSIFGNYAKNILPYVENATIDIKLTLSRRIFNQN
jgi:hypothetical protein